MPDATKNFFLRRLIQQVGTFCCICTRVVRSWCPCLSSGSDRKAATRSTSASSCCRYSSPHNATPTLSLKPSPAAGCSSGVKSTVLCMYVHQNYIGNMAAQIGKTITSYAAVLQNTVRKKCSYPNIFRSRLRTPKVCTIKSKGKSLDRIC